jgi:hypothetical protein
LNDLLPVNQTIDGWTVKFLNVVDEYRQLALVIRVGKRCRVSEVIGEIEELLQLYPPHTHLRRDNAPSSSPTPLRSGVQRAVATCRTSRQVHPGRIYSGSHSTANSKIIPNIAPYTLWQEAKLLAEQHRIECIYYTT